jgi:hypothetical protein
MPDSRNLCWGHHFVGAGGTRNIRSQRLNSVCSVSDSKIKKNLHRPTQFQSRHLAHFGLRYVLISTGRQYVGALGVIHCACQISGQQRASLERFE